MKLRKACILLIAPALALPTHAIAQESDAMTSESPALTPIEMRAQQVIAIVNGKLEPEGVFTDGFLTVVPPQQLAAISQQLTSQFGAAIAVESIDPADGTRAALAIRMEKAIARGSIAIDPSDDNRISELLFQSFDAIDDSPQKIEAELSSLPGDASWWYGPLNGQSPPILAGEWGDQMPIGSTFKLYVLATLAREIAEGKHKWSDVVTLTNPRSFPSGQMQDWPENASVTLETLASLMISISDNTATDALIDMLGRDAVYETVVASGHSEPERNNPFLKTREMFLLKAGPEGRLEAYQDGNADLRSQILDGIEEPALPTSRIQATFSGGPVALDVEWFASASDLANLFRFMRETADPKAFAIMAINPSMPASIKEKWDYVGYKGGSEPGVLNLTWLLQDKNGRDYALVLSWQNSEAKVDQTALELLAQRILALPR